MIKVAHWDQMWRIFRKSWLTLFFASAFVALLIFFDQVRQNIVLPARSDAWKLAVPGIFQILFWISTSLLWSRVVARMSNAKLGISRSFSHLAIVSIGKYLPGKVWGMVARAGEMRRHGIDIQQILSATYMEQLLLLHAGIVLSGVFAAIVSPSLWTSLLAGIAVLSVFGGAFLHNKLFIRFARVYARFRRTSEFAAFPDISPATYVVFLLGYVWIWVVAGIVYWGIFLSFLHSNMQTRHLIPVLLLANTAGVSIGFLAVFAPGGIGVREGISTAILSPFMPITDALLLALLSRVWQVIMDLLSGIFAIYVIQKDKAIR